MKQILKKIASKQAAMLAVLLIAGTALMSTGCTKARAESPSGETVTREEFQQYKNATAETLRLMQDAITELASTKVDKDVYNAKMNQIDAALKKLQ